MVNNNKQIWIGILLFAIIVFFFLGRGVGVFSSIGGNVERTIPSKISAGNSFPVTYTISGTGAYGVSILDTISGGCSFKDIGTPYKGIVLSDEPQVVTLVVTTPSTSAICTFNGDYKFGEQSITKLASDSIIVVSGSECKVDDDCGVKEICKSGLCIPEDEEDLGGDVLKDTFLNKLAIDILNLDEKNLTDKQIKNYILLFYVGVVLVLFFLIKLIYSTPKR